MSVDPCPSCGAAMAADQRYCLACGQRRTEARLDYLEILRGDRAPVAAGVPLAAAGDARQRVNTTVVASIGCLLLAMGVGVLIGNSGGGDGAAVPAVQPAQVIKVQGGGAATAGTAATTRRKPSSAKARSKAKDTTPTAKTAAGSKATNPTLTQLDSTSGDAYTKQSQKLPKVVSTGGKAPPKDNKAPAGGGSFDTIG
ncbi:MAG: hypothetical protein JWM73_1718 [Solirubrobacterales bacterium]|nr:hypothetical protein [Solirubrobacterales bacterium]